jgi:hypothetical protein
MFFRARMFSRYTPSARRVIFYAAHEARHRGAALISPEHLLLGLARDRHAEDCPFGKLHEQREPIAAQLHLAWLPGDAFKGPEIGKDNAPALSKRSKHVLACAARETKHAKQFWLDTDFLQAALLQEGGLVADTLVANGYSLDDTRRFGEEGRRKTPPRKPTLRERAAAYPGLVWFVIGFFCAFAAMTLFFLAKAQ